MLIRSVSFCASLLLLGGLTAERLSLRPPKSAVEYHHRVKMMAEQVPMSFGPWVGKDNPVAPDTTKMLRPNVLINRNYRNLSNGMEVGFLFVQCPDARAIMDHYPPICYVTRGFERDSSHPFDCNAGGAEIRGTEYAFTRTAVTDSVSIVVDNFIVMPEGRIERDMEATKAAASDQARRFFGAGQFQLVFDRGVSREARQETLKAFAILCQKLIQSIQNGQQP